VIPWLDPYDHFETCAAAYAARFPGDDIKWYYGGNALSQNTAQCRVVYVSRDDVDQDEHQLYKGALDMSVSGEDDQEDLPDTIQNDGIGVSVYCFGTRRQLLTYKIADTVFFGLRDRVATILRSSAVGPKNLTFERSGFPQGDFSNLSTALWTWVHNVRYWIPLFDLSTAEGTVYLPITQVDIEEGEVNDGTS